MPKKRNRNFSAAERQLHSIIEKQRREEFNHSLYQLASQIPSLQHLGPNQLFKSTVVSESYKHHLELNRQIQYLTEQLANVTHQRDDAVAQLGLLPTTTGLTQDQFVAHTARTQSDQSSAEQSAAVATSVSPSTNLNQLFSMSIPSIQAPSTPSDPSTEADTTSTVSYAARSSAGQHDNDRHVDSTLFTSCAPRSDILATPSHDIYTIPQLLQASDAAMPFSWHAFSPDNFFLRQLTLSKATSSAQDGGP